MIVGFTGTQAGMTDSQIIALKRILIKSSAFKFIQNEKINLIFENLIIDFSSERIVTGFHHGDCIGADEQAHNIAIEAGIPVYVHPPINSSKRAYCQEYTRRYFAYEYLIRNRHIVDSCEMMLAFPKESNEQLRSGTWATIRYARKVKKPMLIVSPR